MLKVRCPGQRLASLREVGIGYVVTIVVSEHLFEVDVASDTDDLVAGVTAAVVVVVAFTDFVI